MKIIFVSALFPYPLHSGGQVRMFNLIKKLSQKHEITLFSFIRSESENAFKKNVSFCSKVITVMRGGAWQGRYVIPAVTGTYPLLMSTYNNSQMRDLIADELAKTAYDGIHIEPGYIWPCLPKTNLPVVVSEHNIEHEVYAGFVRQSALRLPLWLDVWKLKMWEAKIWKKAAKVTAVSEEDKKYISASSGSKKVDVINNGVDLSTFAYKPKNKRMSEAMTYVYIGNFAWIENQDAVKYLLSEIWPAISRRYPKATLRIVGKNLPGDIKNMARDERVIFLDSVDRIQTELQNADIMLAPIRIGGGTKYKILEAMASGLPVITTKQGAMGLHAKHNKELFIAESGKDILKCVDMIADSGWRLNVVSAARKLIESQYSWDSIAEKLDDIWKGAYGKTN